MASLSVNTSVDTIPVAADWSNSSVSYTVGTYVYYATSVTDNFNGVWVCTTAHTSSASNNPAAGSAYWTPYNNPCWVTSTKTLTISYVSTFTHDKFTGSVYAYASSGAGGKLYIDQSGDGTWASGTYVSNFTKSGDLQVADSTALGFSEEIILPYVRVRYVYTTNRPTTFRLFSRTADSGVKY